MKSNYETLALFAGLDLKKESTQKLISILDKKDAKVERLQLLRHFIRQGLRDCSNVLPELTFFAAVMLTKLEDSKFSEVSEKMDLPKKRELNKVDTYVKHCRLIVDTTYAHLRGHGEGLNGALKALLSTKCYKDTNLNSLTNQYHKAIKEVAASVKDSQEFTSDQSALDIGLGLRPHALLYAPERLAVDDHQL